MNQFKLGKWICLGAIACSLSQVAMATPQFVIEKVVTLSRHGVRPQTHTEKLDKATGLKWPHFYVADGHLTGHGYAGIVQQASYQLKQWHQEGFNLRYSNRCPRSNQVFLWASSQQRIKTTAKALADGMFPGCGIVPETGHAKYDPLFELYHLKQAHPDKQVIKAQIMARMGSSEQAAKRYASAVKLIRQTVCAKDSNSCKFLDKPWKVKFKADGKPTFTGPLSVGATIGETIRLQYSDNLPIRQVAFGHGYDANAVRDLMALHAARYDLATDTPEFAAHGGSLLMRQILSALTKGTKLHRHWLGDKRLSRPLVMFVGHDTNIAEIQTMLGFNWALKDYPANDIPPGASLNFTRFHEKGTHKEFVRVRFVARSLDQWRRLTYLDHQHPLLSADFAFKGCRHTAQGELCPLKLFVKDASKMLVKDGLNLPVFHQ
ncbi:MAG: Periplasmic AppA protein [Candidatus Celerinatantimonas neptuna]|nr:MAG: Periplasmic AppA protein [Candidatus Celerinatantimonas neptuna]